MFIWLFLWYIAHSKEGMEKICRCDVLRMRKSLLNALKGDISSGLQAYLRGAPTRGPSDFVFLGSTTFQEDSLVTT